jgi:hypothetical protein
MPSKSRALMLTPPVLALRRIMSVSPELEKLPKPMTCQFNRTVGKNAALVMRLLLMS